MSDGDVAFSRAVPAVGECEIEDDARNGSFGTWLTMLVRLRCLALVDGAGRVLHQVRQRGAEVVELIGKVGVAELVRRDSAHWRSRPRRGRRR